jgi:non-specific serine/threonine protein kinase
VTLVVTLDTVPRICRINNGVEFTFLRLRQGQGDVLATAQSLEYLAGLAGRQGQCERAVRLLGAAEALAATLGRILSVAVADEYERTVASARAALGEPAFTAAWAKGRAMALEAAVAFALGDTD